MEKLVISFYSLIFATLKPSKPAKYTPPMFLGGGQNFPLLQDFSILKKNKKVQFWVRFATFLILAIARLKKGNCFLDRSR
jgi:hypothetical protein